MVFVIFIILDKITGETMENKTADGLECIAEDEEHIEEEISEVTGPITDDATTEDETVDHTQASDDEGTNFEKCPF